MFERPKHSMFDDAVTDLVLKTASKKLSKVNDCLLMCLLLPTSLFPPSYEIVKIKSKFCILEFYSMLGGVP